MSGPVWLPADDLAEDLHVIARLVAVARGDVPDPFDGYLLLTSAYAGTLAPPWRSPVFDLLGYRDPDDDVEAPGPGDSGRLEYRVAGSDLAALVAEHEQMLAARPAHFVHHRSGLRVRWHKHVRRDTEMSAAPAPGEWARVVDDCLRSLAGLLAGRR